MKLRPTQFGVRENTASPRQHAPRLPVSHSQSQSNGVSGNSKGDESSPHMRSGISMFEPSLTEAANAATRGERTENGQLLSVHDVADLLQVPVSWVYGHTRDRCPDRIPGFRLGKYWRFDEADVLAWIQRRRPVMRRNSCASEYNGTR
jgi:excisionase family DNA binding protein